MAQPHFSSRHDREPSNSIADAVDRLIARLDMLAYDARLGHPNTREYERQADEACSIATDLRAVYRAPVLHQVHPTGYHAALGYGG